MTVKQGLRFEKLKQICVWEVDFMRKCIRCDVEMQEKLDVKVEGAAYGLKITEPGIFKENLGKVCAAVCPSCGYLELYIEDTAKLTR